MCGWFNILCVVYLDLDELRGCDVIVVYLAGVGVNVIILVRGGDFLKFFLVHKRMLSVCYFMLFVIFGLEMIFEVVFSVGFVIWVFIYGFLFVLVLVGELFEIDVLFVIVYLLLVVGVLILGGGVLFVLVRWVWVHVRGFVVRFK